MKPSIDFIQIIYKQEQWDKCYPWTQKYFNHTLTDYFENSVIADVVPTLNADYISVCSWRLGQKRGPENPTFMHLNGKVELTEDRILEQEFDVAVLTPRSPRHRMLENARQWHGEAWDQAFTCFRGFLYDQGVRGLKEVSTTIYENHFIAKREIYHDYVNNWLRPAIAFMDDRDVFRLDSGYIHKKRDAEEIKNYQEKSGRKDWPISCFVLERLFSIFIEGKGYKIINL
jgi:hypothetical protein